jgi:hypothetical protein
MIDPNKVTKAVMEFMQNPTWKHIFTNAPGGAMERLAISFYFSKYHNEFTPEDFQEYRELRDEYEQSMNAEDLQYLLDNSESEAASKHYQELLAKIQQSGEPKGKIRFEKENENSSDNPESGEQVEEQVGEQVVTEESKKEVNRDLPQDDKKENA